MAAALHGQQVVLDRLRDELVADLEAVVGSLDEEAVVERLDDAGAEVGIEHAVAAPRARGRSRRDPIDQALEGRRNGRELAPVERSAGRREEAQDTPAFRCA